MAIILDAVSGQTRITSQTSGTVAFTCSGTNRLLYVTIISNTNPPTGVTYGGVSMTQIGTTGLDASGRRCTTFYLINPNTGSNNIVASFGSSTTFVIYASSYTNVKQTSPIIANQITTSFTATGITTNLTSKINGYMIMSGTWNSGAGATAISNCVMRQVEIAYIGSYQVDNISPITGTSNIGWTSGTSQNITGIAISLEDSSSLNLGYLPMIHLQGQGQIY